MTTQVKTHFTPALEKRFNTQLKKIYVEHSQVKKDRPILNNINVTEDGRVQITNSFVGVQLENTDARPTHLEQYPDMTRLFDNNRGSYDESFQVFYDDLKILENHLNVIYKQKVEVVDITFSNNGIVIENGKPSYDDVFLKSEIATELNVDTYTIRVKPKYLHDALMFYRQVFKTGYFIRVWTYDKYLVRLSYCDVTYIMTTNRTY